MIGLARLRADADVVSVANLYSGALFLVPCVVLHVHAFRLLALQAAMVCGLSLVYHRQTIATGYRVSPALKAADVANSGLACAAVLWHAWGDPIAFALTCGVPLFWGVEHALMARGHFAGALWGPVGLHSLVHLSAISSMIVVARPTADDVYPAALACTAGLTAAALAEPELFQTPATLEERRRAWAGVQEASSIAT